MGLYVQRDALIIAQKALDITGNNISNINTPGYTRQRVDVCSVAHTKSTLGYNTAVSLAGQGAQAIGVSQIRDRLLDKKVRTYSSDLCDVGIKTNVLSNVEDVFDSIEADSIDKSESGASFASIMSRLKAALQGFSVDDADRTEMANITKGSAESLVQCVVNYNSKLNDISEQTLKDAKDTVQRINAIFSEMGELNKQIKESYISMNYYTSKFGNYEVMNDYGPLELKDKMNVLIDELAQYGNVDFDETEEGTFVIDFADRRVVDDKYFAQMAITKDDPKPTELELVISKNLMVEEDWYRLNVDHGTGGNSELVVRNFPDDVGGTMNVTDKNTDGVYKLDSGSLRGYLDVYNGRGIYAAGAKTSLETSTDTLSTLKELNAEIAKIRAGAGTDAEKDEAVKKLKEKQNEKEDIGGMIERMKTAIGADVTENADGTYSATVKIGGVDTTILDGDKAASFALDGTVFVNGNQTQISPDTIGGVDCTDTVNDALANLAEANKKLAELKTKMDAAGTDDSLKIALTNRKNDIYEDSKRFIKVLENAGITVTKDIDNYIYSASIKDGTADIDLLTGANNSTPAEFTAEQNVMFSYDGTDTKLDTADIGGAFTDYVAADEKIIGNAYKGIEYYRDMLNSFVKTMTDEFNGIFSEFGYEILTYDNDVGDADFRTAAENFRIGKDWLNNPEIISNPRGDNKYEELDNYYINKLLGVFAVEQTYGDGVVKDSLSYRPEEFVNNISDDVGKQVGHEQNVYDATDVMLTSVEKQRSGRMDVAMDEEGINMMNYQKWYNAIARMISTMDEALDKLINGTGVVGLR